MNIRKWLCKIAKTNHWKTLYDLCNCKRYEPAPTPPIPPVPPTPEPPPPEPPVPPPPPATPKMLIATSCYELMEFLDHVIEWFLRQIFAAGGNCTEIFPSYSWSAGAHLQPYLKIGEVYDYTKENPEYWRKLRFIMGLCAELGITLVIRLFDYCSVRDAEDYELLCWHHSRQKNDWQNAGKAWGGFYGTTATDGKGPRPYMAAFVHRIEGLVAETKCKVIYHAINEPGYNPTKGEVENWIGRPLPVGQANWNLTPIEEDLIRARKDKIILEFHEWLYTVVKFKIANPDLRFKKTVEWAKAQGLWLEVHGCNSLEKLYTAHQNGGIGNGDGPDPYARGRQGDKPEKREPSVAQAAKMGSYIKINGIPFYGTFNRAIENPMPPDLNRAQFDVLKMMIKNCL